MKHRTFTELLSVSAASLRAAAALALLALTALPVLANDRFRSPCDLTLQPPAVAPIPTSPIADFERRLTEIDAKAASITDVRATFGQIKRSALLVEPLVSKGEVLSKGAVTLWLTTEPDETKVRVDATSMRVYYVKSAVVEEYPLERALASITASPLPRLRTLRELFSIVPDTGDPLVPVESARNQLAAKLVPQSSDLQRHIASVRVLLDADRGTVMVFEITDPDGERTTIRFSAVRIGEGIRDDQLELHAGDARVVRPFDAKSPR